MKKFIKTKGFCISILIVCLSVFAMAIDFGSLGWSLAAGIGLVFIGVGFLNDVF